MSDGIHYTTLNTNIETDDTFILKYKSAIRSKYESVLGTSTKIRPSSVRYSVISFNNSTYRI